MKASLTSDMHIHRIFLLCSQVGRKGRSETGYHIISLHTNMITHTHEHAPDVFVDRVRAEREMVRWIGTEGEVMLDHFANTAI